jgi:membrane protein implicated in regulation of membrane protease activity
MILLLALLLFFLLDLSGTTAVVFLAGACVLEVGEIWFLRRWSKRLERKQPPVQPDEELIGMVGEVVTPCRPRGQVRVRGELWSAICASGAEPGAEVRVEAVDELSLVVAPRG